MTHALDNLRKTISIRGFIENLHSHSFHTKHYVQCNQLPGVSYHHRKRIQPVPTVCPKKNPSQP